MANSPRRVKTTTKGKKRAASNVSEEMSTVNTARSKRARRLSTRALKAAQTSEDAVVAHAEDVADKANKQPPRRRSERREVESDTGPTLEKNGEDHSPDVPGEVAPLGSEPSTVTRDVWGLQGHAQTETDEINPVPGASQTEAPDSIPPSVPQEGGAAIEESERSDGSKQREDGTDRNSIGEPVQHAKEVIAKPREPEHSEKVPDTINEGHGEVRNEYTCEESDCDASPPKSTTVDFSVLVDKIGKLEEKIVSLETNLKAKVDHVVNAVGSDGSGADLENIIHSLCHHLDTNVQSASYIENKLIPLKNLLNGGLHRKCLGKFIMDKLVKSLGDAKSLDPKVLNDVAKILRVVLYSKSVGGKKDKKCIDDKGLELQSREMKGRMTWILINHIQSNPSVGKQTVCIGEETKLVGKPYWMESGFTEKKHINDFYSKNKHRKSGKLDAKDVMAEAIVKKVNDHHVKAFGRVRDRMRCDLMLDLWYIYDLDGIDVEKMVDPTYGPIDVSTIPLVRVPKGASDSQKKRILTNIWHKAAEIVGDKATFTFKYEATIVMKTGEEAKKEVTRKINFFLVAALILLKITNNGNFLDLLMYHEKSLHVIAAIGQLVVTITEHEFVGSRLHGMTKKEECEVDDESFHILNVLEMMRPTQYTTRKELLDENIIKMDEDMYNSICADIKENDQVADVPKSTEPDAEKEDSGSDEDGLCNGAEVDDALAFLSK